MLTSVPGDELEIVDGGDVRRIGDGDDEGLAGPVHRDNAVPLDHLLGDQGQDVSVDVELGQVDRGNAVLLGEKLSEIVLLDRAHSYERVPQALARLPALFLSALQLLWRDDLIPEQ
jgi:hypothetical protein